MEVRNQLFIEYIKTSSRQADGKMGENKVSNRLFQGIVHQMRDAVGRTVGVIDETSSVISCSDLARIGETADVEFASIGEGVVSGGMTYRLIPAEQGIEFAAFVEGDKREYSDQGSRKPCPFNSRHPFGRILYPCGGRNRHLGHRNKGTCPFLQGCPGRP